ncbi:rhodanese-like domain-containing protein [Nonomuraea angiospora]|uniref:Rhodanese-related sulfurtransferase n=1 Tax=Nonomuraea angiospora TaxID=46172 RepID=A0ABR9M0Y3_9ACTN|nr:rhodanese-like domain-containing protein [Nonomuraea angiospora]MBE1586566.1 rhodanese-related sulfurtransferase [Nonomuraea angiospora]
MRTQPTEATGIPAAQVRALLLRRDEVVIADVREEAVYAQGHPLWAASFPLSRLEPDAWRRIPRRDTPIVVYGDADAPAQQAIDVLRQLGYSRAHALLGGLDGWIAAGGELFQDVNVPSKAFGELVESINQTPSLTAQHVRALIDSGKPPVIVDARRFDEFHTMSIPTATSMPGAELVLRVRELAPDPATPVVVNCAGRTRSIIGAQSLINAGLPNPVAALRNGTIGWTLAGQRLDHGATRTAPRTVTESHHALALAGARAIGRRAGVRFIRPADLPGLHRPDRTTYVFDVRSAAEFAGGHLDGSRHAPGGQLVQETDHYAPVRGARIVLVDDDGVRAAMTGSWLAQMGWETWAISPAAPEDLTRQGEEPDPLPEPPQVDTVDAATLRTWLGARQTSTVVIDVAPSRDYAAGHIPGAWYAARARLPAALGAIGPATRFVVTSPTGVQARFAAADLRRLTPTPVFGLDGGTAAWRTAAPLESDPARYAVAPADRYRRPYEGTDNARTAMEAYLAWEFGLVEQLERDGTHHFRVLR